MYHSSFLVDESKYMSTAGRMMEVVLRSKYIIAYIYSPLLFFPRVKRTIHVDRDKPITKLHDHPRAQAVYMVVRFDRRVLEPTSSVCKYGIGGRGYGHFSSLRTCETGPFSEAVRENIVILETALRFHTLYHAPLQECAHGASR